ncbi:hypothetical protein ASZ90_016236 [hydrocarbon metagenome]|uniref:Uncharacterized protein n=1 Tax=hydrocarbon metagenome TaxID=938273 RepID=A0A0W8F0J2_9ZZZZ
MPFRRQVRISWLSPVHLHKSGVQGLHKCTSGNPPGVSRVNYALFLP